MASIWKQNRDVTNDVKRNNFDLSFSNHSTFKFGYLYPVFSKRVYPTDSFRIDSAFDLKMMPLVFPVQSRIRANLHFFYVRNKNLWKNWEDWISGLKDNTSHPHPYITPNDSDVVNGSIYDFLNTPTTVVTSNPVSTPLRSRNVDSNGVVRPIYYVPNGSQGCSLYTTDDSDNPRPQAIVIDVKKELKYGDLLMPSSEPFLTYLNRVRSSITTPFSIIGCSYNGNTPNVLVYQQTFSVRQFPVGKFVIPNEVVDWVNTRVGWSNVSLVIATASAGTTVFNSYTPTDITTAFFPWQFIPSTGVVNYSDLGLNYYKNIQPLNALAFRAYQSIYYGYYANDVLQPLMINGEKEYNKFIENDDDGLDTTNYHLYKRNYELDFLTSALPSPQAGPAPLVGVSALGGVTITDANGVSTGQAVLDSDGNITKIVATSPIASVDHARTMMNIAALGFNINDLRSANALQRLAEQTLRSGYRYINWVKGQFGRSPEYRELDMPEFIGGYSRDVQITSIISQADTLGLAEDKGMGLGDYGANGRIIGGSNHSITHYCDDYGFIIGVMSVTPTPAYSQLLPKQMIAPNSPLDYANPFMNQIGMQPITYREVCPIQAYIDSLVDSDKSVDDVFGYQRPNYDEVGSVDEVHGEFRSTMKDFLINRQFDGRPELGKDFIEINPSEINDIFANQNPDDDVFIGHLAFKVTPKRPFPRVHVPGLGR